jgi:hypothetical protein
MKLRVKGIVSLIYMSDNHVHPKKPRVKGIFIKELAKKGTGRLW